MKPGVRTCNQTLYPTVIIFTGNKWIGVIRRIAIPSDTVSTLPLSFIFLFVPLGAVNTTVTQASIASLRKRKKLISRRKQTSLRINKS